MKQEPVDKIPFELTQNLNEFEKGYRIGYDKAIFFSEEKLKKIKENIKKTIPPTTDFNIWIKENIDDVWNE